MASVAKDPRDGRWLARWRDPAGRQHKKSFRRRVDADRWLAQMLAEMHRGQYVDPAGGKVYVATLADKWAKGLAHLKPSTAERYRSVVRSHILPRWGRWPVGSISHSDVADWVAELAEIRSPGSVRQIHRVLSLIFDAAVLDGRIGRNPAKHVKLPRQVRGEPHFLAPDEVAALAEAAGEYSGLILVLAFTGMRIGEACALRVRRVDVLRRRIEVSETTAEIGGQLVSGTPKNHQRRSIAVPRSLIPVLEDAIYGKGPDDFVFTSPEGQPLRLRNWRARVFNPACEKAGLVGVTPHDLRHTAASLAIAGGAHVKVVQRMLGHASAAMTLDVYAGLFHDDLDSVAEALDAVVPQVRHTGPRSPGDDRGTDVRDAV